MPRYVFPVVALLLAAPGFAQQPPASELRIVIVDETGAGIPGATVTVTPADGPPIAFAADDRGRAISPPLPSGTVQVRVEFAGFEPYEGRLSLRRGATNQTVTLRIEGVREEVVVSDEAALDDRRGNALTTTLEENEIAELPEDPEELAEVLTQMAGGAGVVFQVNGFRGGRLPSREEIRQVRFRTNSFSADNHEAGRTQIEIITRPNVRQWSGNGSFNYRSDAMNARNAFASAKTPEENRTFNVGARGPLVAGRTSIRLGVDGRRNYEADTIVAVDETGRRLGDYVRRPSESTNYTIGLEHGLTADQTLRLEFRRGENATRNSGVGGFNLPERAFESENRSQELRVQLQGVVRRTMLNEFRFRYRGQDNATESASSAPAIIVLDAFSRGGAGVSSRGSSRTFEVADNFDFTVARRHQMRFGFLLEGGRYENFDARNAAGTFTFSSIDAFLAGRPATFTQRQGQVDTAFNQHELGFYWQDDIRVSNKVSLSVGVRNEMQSHVADRLNLMPRFGFTLTPWGNRTSIRGGYGLFYDWYESSLYDQTLRVDGISQRDLLILNPGYPDPSTGTLADVQPGGRVQADPGLKMPHVHQASIGIDRQLAENFGVQASYLLLRGRNQLRSRNVNAPDELGTRPDPSIGTVTQFESTGRSQSDRLQVGANFRVPQRGIFMNVNYTLGSVKNHADNATQLPADSRHPDAEWGFSRQDVRHRLQGMINVPLVYGVRTSINVQGQSASPYTITTGRDDNRDGVVNDRPAGVGRNTARGEATWTVNLRLTKQVGLGGPREGPGGGGRGGPFGPGGAPGGPGVRPPGGGDGGGSSPVQAPRFAQRGGGGRGGDGARGGRGAGAGSRYTMEFFVTADNVLNRVNYGGFSGNMLSPFFERPTSARQPRRVTVGTSFRF